MPSKLMLSTALLVLTSFNSYSQDYDGVFDEDVYIKLSYAACYRGNCPRFEVTILGNGMVIFEGINGVSSLGVTQKKIEKQKVADLLSGLLSLRYFERTDESKDCNYASVEIIEGGNYEEQGSICVTSSHGPFTDINVIFGDKKRKVQLEHYFSDDYEVIKQEIIKTADVQKWVKKK